MYFKNSLLLIFQILFQLTYEFITFFFQFYNAILLKIIYILIEYFFISFNTYKLAQPLI
jgi:hypothetical protein